LVRWESPFDATIYLTDHATKLLRGLTLAQAGCNAVNFRAGVLVELFQAGTKVIEAGFAIRRTQQTVLRTFAPAVGEIWTFPAILRQRVGFVVAEFDLRRGENHFAERLFLNLPEPVFGIHVMVTRVHAAVMFHRHALPAKLVVDANLRRHSHVLRDERLEVIDQNAADVLSDPFVEDLAEKITILLGINRPIGDD